MAALDTALDFWMQLSTKSHATIAPRLIIPLLEKKKSIVLEKNTSSIYDKKSNWKFYFYYNWTLIFFKQQRLLRGSLSNPDLGVHIQNFSVKCCKNLLHVAENLPFLSYQNLNATLHCKLKTQWSNFCHCVYALLSWQDNTLSHKPIRLGHLTEFNNFYRLQH